MEDQIKYQRSVIRDDYITEEDIDKCIEEGKSVPAVSEMRKRRKRSLEGVGAPVGKLLPKYGKVEGGIDGSNSSVHKLFR